MVEGPNSLLSTDPEQGVQHAPVALVNYLAIDAAALDLETSLGCVDWEGA